MHDQRKRRIVADIATYVLLTVLGVIWLLPIVWIFLESFNKNTAPYQDTFFPTEYSLDSYISLFTEMMHTKTAMMNVFMNMRGKLSTLVSVNRLM